LRGQQVPDKPLAQADGVIVLAFETIFGLPAERLTIRHDAGKGAGPYVHMTLLAVRRVMQVTGLMRRMDKQLFDG
jgi:hypothetical protein